MGKTRDSLNKIGDTKGIFPARIHTIKNRNEKDLTEVEEIKERWQEELYIKGHNNEDNHNSVIIHIAPDIMECEVKWNLGSIVTNKASGGDEIPAELFKTLMLLKCCTQYVSKFGEHSSGYRTEKV